MPRKKVEPVPAEPVVETPPPADPPADVAADAPQTTVDLTKATEPDDEPDEYGPNNPDEKPAEPVPEPVPEPVAEPDPGHVGFTHVHDPYAPDTAVVVRYPLPPVVTVTASWLSDAEAKVLRAQHQPVVNAANTVPETKDADTTKE